MSLLCYADNASQGTQKQLDKQLMIYWIKSHGHPVQQAQDLWCLYWHWQMLRVCMAHELKYSPLTLMFKYFAISDMFVFEESTKNILNTFENMLESL